MIEARFMKGVAEAARKARGSDPLGTIMSQLQHDIGEAAGDGDTDVGFELEIDDDLDWVVEAALLQLHINGYHTEITKGETSWKFCVSWD